MQAVTVRSITNRYLFQDLSPLSSISKIEDPVELGGRKVVSKLTAEFVKIGIQWNSMVLIIDVFVGWDILNT